MSGLFNGSGPSANRLGMSRPYPDPFLAYSTSVFPTTMEEVWRWGEQIWLKNGPLAGATTRVVSYFLTEPVIKGTRERESAESAREQKVAYDLLVEQLGIHGLALRFGREYIAYGNAFTSLIAPFIRLLRCDRCSGQTNIKFADDARIKESDRRWGITWRCRCGHQAFDPKPRDLHIPDAGRAKIKFWTPREIHVMHNRVTDDYRYFWRPSGEEQQKLTGPTSAFYLETYPWEMVQTVMAGGSALYEFEKGAIHHGRCFGLSGFETNGWGLPPAISNFSQAYYAQLMTAYNEVIAHEYMMPFRCFSPPAASADTSNPISGGGRQNFNRRVGRMLEEHRRNPGGFHALPFPVQYQQFGGEGQAMTEFDHIERAMDALLNAMGVPVEFYKMNLGVKSAPAMIRLFQNAWAHLMHALNDWLNWIGERLVEAYELPQMTIRWKQVLMADDLDRRNVIFNLMGANKISTPTALKLLGLDATDELKTIYEFQGEQAKLEREFQEQQAEEQQMEQTLIQRSVDRQSAAAQQAQGGQPGAPGGQPGGQPPGGAQGGAPAGAPGPGGASPSAVPPGGGLPQNPTPQDVTAEADRVADRWLSLDDGSRKREMAEMRKSNEPLWMAAKAKMEQKRNKARSIGQQQAMPQVIGQKQA